MPSALARVSVRRFSSAAVVTESLLLRFDNMACSKRARACGRTESAEKPPTSTLENMRHQEQERVQLQMCDRVARIQARSSSRFARAGVDVDRSVDAPRELDAQAQSPAVRVSQAVRRVSEQVSAPSNSQTGVTCSSRVTLLCFAVGSVALALTLTRALAPQRETDLTIEIARARSATRGSSLSTCSSCAAAKTRTMSKGTGFALERVG